MANNPLSASALTKKVRDSATQLQELVQEPGNTWISHSTVAVQMVRSAGALADTALTTAIAYTGIAKLNGAFVDPYFRWDTCMMNSKVLFGNDCEEIFNQEFNEGIMMLSGAGALGALTFYSAFNTFRFPYKVHRAIKVIDKNAGKLINLINKNISHLEQLEKDMDSAPNNDGVEVVDYGIKQKKMPSCSREFTRWPE